MVNLSGQNLGRYHVIERLGEGGMATVYKAFDTSLERNVAIKIIRADMKVGTEQNEFLKRFQREAKALAQLDHPYILKVLDYGEQDCNPYLVMPFVQGGTLKERMGRPIFYQEAAAILAPIAQALDYAHQRKVIHRDVKPANILISETNTPLLSDFGIAKILESGESTQLTATGVGIGTPDYMAPEQWMGKADPRTDIYALGVVFFQMVTGRLPFTADTPAAVLIKHMQDPLPRPSTFVTELPEAVEQVLYKALAKEPENRFQDMATFAGALEKLSRGEAAGLKGLETAAPTVVSAGARSDFETVKAPITVPGPHGQGKAQAPAMTPPSKKKIAGWQIGLIVTAAVGVLVVIAVVAGAAFFLPRLASRLNPTAALADNGVPTTAEATNNPLATAQSTPLQGFAAPTLSALDYSTQPTPFLSIDGFPSDVPMLTDNNGDLITQTSGQGGEKVYTYSTNLPSQQVVDFFESGMASNSWQVIQTMNGSGMQMWTYQKGDRTVMIEIVTETDQPVRVIIMIQ
jgi:serine/threonine protein kinase